MRGDRRDAAVISPKGYTPEFWHQLLRLHGLLLWARWGMTAACWIALGLPSLWALREELRMMGDYFTWPALRYALAFNLLPTLGLTLCLSLMLSTLIWQSRNIVLGLPLRDIKRLERQLQRINNHGPSHPLWDIVHRPKSTKFR